jgi:hypothetical protein
MRLRMRSVALLFVGSIIGCERPSPTTDGGGDLRPDPCPALTQQVNAWIAAHQSCNADSDCAGVAAYGFIYNQGSDVSCWPPLAISTNGQSGLMQLFNQMFAARCDGPTRICSAIFPMAACSQHLCATK